MNGTKTFFACVAAAPRWFVVNEDNDHFFKCDSALYGRKGAVGLVDVVAFGNNAYGIDIEMARDVFVEGCAFREGDDAIVVKAERRDGRRRFRGIA